MTDQQGAYTLDTPEGELGLLTSQSKNYVPVAHLLSGMDEGEPAPVDLKMDTPTKDLKGTVRLKPLESWHFLAGKRYERTGGDFYFCIHDGVPKFCANAFHQLGLMEVDVGKDVPLDEIPIPKQGFSKSGVEAKEGATYVSRASRSRTTTLSSSAWFASTRMSS